MIAKTHNGGSSCASVHAWSAWKCVSMLHESDRALLTSRQSDAPRCHLAETSEMNFRMLHLLEPINTWPCARSYKLLVARVADFPHVSVGSDARWICTCASMLVARFAYIAHKHVNWYNETRWLCTDSAPQMQRLLQVADFNISIFADSCSIDIEIHVFTKLRVLELITGNKFRSR